MKNNENDFLSFYGQHHISPVRQDIKELDVHFMRREKLYRQLGMPRMLFDGKEVCEVGPGGGYNSLVFFGWNIAHLDLVEANSKGIEDMEMLFEKNNIDESLYTINNTTIETYATQKKYDVVIAEGFLHYLPNQKEVIDKLGSITKPGGIIVITCADDICFYIEQMKRLIAHVLTMEIEDFEKKVQILSEKFGAQLNQLKGVSRSAEDWVQDQLLNPASVNDNSLSMMDAMEMFSGDADYLGSSPRMFTDYSWYKDIWYDSFADYKEQFIAKNANLMLANMEEEIWMESSEWNKLRSLVTKSKKICREFENTKNLELLVDVYDHHLCIAEVLANKSFELSTIMSEISQALRDISSEEVFDFQKYPHFFSAFGRTLQYISFVKK